MVAWSWTTRRYKQYLESSRIRSTELSKTNFDYIKFAPSGAKLKQNQSQQKEREEKKPCWLSILSVPRQMVLRTFISWDNEKLGKEGTSGWDTRNLTTMAAGLMISKPLCLQICTSCNFISREIRKAETLQAAGGHVVCSHVNQNQRGPLKDSGLTAG